MGSRTIAVGSQAVDRIDYDPSADVLYLTVGDPADAVDFDESPEGHGLRFDAEARLMGMTVVGARSQLDRTGSLTVTGPVDLRIEGSQLAELLSVDRPSVGLPLDPCKESCNTGLRPAPEVPADQPVAQCFRKRRPVR